MIEIQGFFTKKGLALAAKLAAGETLKITRAVAGAGQTVQTASALSQIRQTLTIGYASRRENTATLPVTLTAGLASTAYTLREVGLYAQDPSEGEILYKVYRLGDPINISPASRLVLRFYLEETVSESLNITIDGAPAGFITEADLAVIRDRVDTAAVSGRAATVAASNLQAYINALPKLRTENLYITVAGELTQKLVLSNFYGSGKFYFYPQNNQTVFRAEIDVEQCTVEVELHNLQFQMPLAGTFDGTSCIHAGGFSHVRAIGCSFSGTAEALLPAPLHANDGGIVIATRVQARYCSAVALVVRAGIAVISCSAEHENPLHDNQYGVHAWEGGIAIIANRDTPMLLGGIVHHKQGGMVIKSDGMPA